MPLEGQSTLLIFPVRFCFHTCFCFIFTFVYFSGKLYLNCAYTQASQVFSLGVSSYPRLENIGTCHSAWVTSVPDKALFYFLPQANHTLSLLFTSLPVALLLLISHSLLPITYLICFFYSFVKEVFIRCNPC